jgi:tetratricopeptide (TPR) repeat protein
MRHGCRTAPGARSLARLSLAVTAALAPLLLACVVEVGMRTRVARPPDTAAMQQLRNATIFHQRCAVGALLGPRRAGAPRIAVVGESSGEYVGQQLRALASGRALRVANCAQAASPLEFVEQHFDEAAAADPDDVVIVFGHNLWFELPSTRAAIALEWLRLHSRLFALLKGDVHVSAPNDPAYMRARIHRFERFLHRAAAVARARRFTLVVSTMTPNYWLPPITDAAAERRLAEARFLRAIGDAPGERRVLDDLAASTDAAPAHFARGEALARAGDRAGALRALDRAIERWPLSRTTLAANEAIRRVARAEGLRLRDTWEVMRTRASDGIPGWESVVDWCHLSAPLIRAEAVETLRLLGHPLADQGAAPPPAPLPEVHRTFVEAMQHPRGSITGRNLDDAAAFAYHRLLSEGGADARRALDQALDALDAPGGAVDAAVRARVHAAAAEALWTAGDRGRARALNQRAREEAAGAAAAPCWVQLGLFDVEEGRRADATASFRRALTLDPTSVAQTYLALLQRHPDGPSDRPSPR